MLLRRVTLHVSNQNWTAVFLDFAIVVIGVFIGIQVANWNAEQSNQRTSERLILRLAKDFDESYEYLTPLGASIHEAMVALDAQLGALEREDPLLPEAAREAASRWTYAEFIPPPPASFEEMINTGRLDLVSATSLRTALRRVQELADLIKVTNALSAENYQDAIRDLSPHLRFVREPQAQSSNHSVSALDQTAIWEDAQARRALYMLYEMHRNNNQWLQAYTRAIDHLLEQIERHKSAPE